MSASLAMLLQSQLDPTLTAEALLTQMRSDWLDLDPSLLRLGEAPPATTRAGRPTTTRPCSAWNMAMR